MLKNIITCLIMVTGFILTQTTVTAQEFPIAVGKDSTIAGGAAFDGTNYLVGIQGDTLSQSNITAQLVSPSGSLVGSRISVGRVGGLPIGGPMIAFDGSHYLLVWTDPTLSNTDVYGQFVDPSGTLKGTVFPIASTVDDEYCGDVASGDSTYLVVWLRNNFLYRQLLSKTGTLLGSAQQISDHNVQFNLTFFGETAVAFDGTNYLIVWQSRRSAEPEGYDIYGRFVGESGSATDQFVISETPSSSFNPLSIAFDGSNYLVAWNKDIGPGYPSPAIWDIYARKVSPSGMMGTPEFPIATAPGDQIQPSIAFDGTNYLITWNELNDTLSINKAVGRFFTISGAPVDNVFTIFDIMENKFPLNGRLVFGGSQYLSIASRITVSRGDSGFQLTDGDVYGTFIKRINPTGVKESEFIGTPNEFSLLQNYPNPFNPTTVIKYSIKNAGMVSLKVYDILGQEVATLVNKSQTPGPYEVEFNAKNLTSGIYFYRLTAGSFSETKKLILLK